MLLHRYLGDWARDVVRQIRAGPAGTPVRVLYIDGFAVPGATVPRSGAGDARGQRGAVGVMDGIVHTVSRFHRVAETVAVFMEEDPVKVQWLLGELTAAGLADRVRVDADPATMRAGDVAVLETSFAAFAEPVAALVASADHALVRLAPPRAEHLPLNVISPIMAGRGTELLIQLPTGDVHQPARLNAGSLADLPPRLRRTVHGYAALYGMAPHNWLSLWRSVYSAASSAAAQVRLVEAYRACLERTMLAGVIKPFALRCPETDGTVHSMLVARDALRALSLNRTLFRARSDGLLDCAVPAEPQAGATFVTEEQTATLDLFTLGDAGSGASAGFGTRSRVVNVAAVAHFLTARFGGERATLGEIAEAVIGSDLFPDELKRVLARMKRERRVAYLNLTSAHAEIQFAAGERLPVPPLGNAEADDVALFRNPEVVRR